MSIGHAIKWSFFSEIASKAVAPLVFVILARLLTPDDFGVVAAATMVITFSQVFWEAGLSKAVIQYQGDPVKAANAAFWVNILLGVLVALTLALSAELIASKVFHDLRVTSVLQVMALLVLIAAATSIQTALLQKQMQFKALFWIRALTVTVPGLISIPLAVHGMGYWSLVLGTVTGQLLQAIALWMATPWRPTLALDLPMARTLSRFGIWVAVSGLFAWFYQWMDALFIGVYLGAHELGLFRTGNTFVIMAYGVFFSPLLPVLYSHLARIQSDRATVANVTDRVVRLVTFVGVPIAFLLFSFREFIGQIVFGSHWQGIPLIIGVMGLTHGFAWIVGTNSEAYRAIGHPDYETKVMASTLLLYAIAYWISVRKGLEVFVWTRFCVALVAIGIHLWVARVALSLSIWRTVTYVARISMVGIPVIVLSNSSFALRVLEQWTLVTIAVAWVVASLWFLERKSLIPETIGLLKSGLSK